MASSAVSAMGSVLANARTIQAFKVALAAGIAWVMVLPWGGPADTYPYYAPLGAVTSMVGTVAGSLRTTVSAIVAIAIGAVPALLALYLDMSGVFSLVVVVLVGSWLAGSDRLGPMASWVPTSGLFILIIGADDPWTYVAAYVGLMAFGALVGLVVDALWPSLPLKATQRTLDALRDTLAGQMRELAEGLRADPLPTADEWHERRHAIDDHERRMHAMVGEARDARRANWRAARWRETADRQYRQARALEQLSFLVEEAFDLVARGEHEEREEVALGAELRPSAVRALETTADVLSRIHDDTVDEDCWVEAVGAVERLGDEIRSRRYNTESEFFTAGSLVITLRRALESVRPRDRATW